MSIGKLTVLDHTRKVPVVSAATVERVVRALAADDMLGRAAGQAEGQKAARFLAGEFKRIGLQPLPGAAGFEQPFEVYNVTPQPAAVVVNGNDLALNQVMMTPGPPTLLWTSEDAQPARTVTVGPNPAELEKLNALLQPTQNTLVFIDPVHAEAFAQAAAQLAQAQVSPAKPSFYATVFVLAKVPTGPITYRVSGATSVKPLTLRNVVGVLPGRNPVRTQEQIIFSAHYDHLGVLAAVQGDSIANGADDDASGTAAVVALAEYFKKRNDNARTLVFVAFDGEEAGLLGSQHFAQQLDARFVTAMLNIEMIGKPAKFGPNSAFITGFDKSSLAALLQAGAQGTGFRFEPDPYPEQQAFYRSDNAPLARLGIPAHTIVTDQLPTDKLYHTVDDEVASLDLANMTAVIRAIARSSAGLVSGQQTPTRLAAAPANGNH
ncbi:M20/M25/M40 family metallo-hydrolase [Hymenobacter weizhouensis]|uniref:M20/M25/M40 family metallo-hydrolase n=1 Tax=Hymenobacter sp. YIM 151500-1 TaxID=2987689 RepID=UPI0022272E62|nr:M20/M25/M40 family metallo-hydrolase [Hymenobacter sp. YIM 151500-1]UYZ61647.1 M20/M25/M40 family metallo-hydrolase [Hymenobacter sp. YIM 151500-1]